jgi:4-alpha-glucanotransferase
MTAPDPALPEALRRLEVDDLLLGLPDRSFPSVADADVGIGSPYAPSSEPFLAGVRAAGFTGIQLGPQGETSEGNASPYDGTVFSRGRLSVSLARLATDPAWAGLLSPATLEALVAGRPDGPAQRIAYRYAHRAHRAALGEAFAAFVTGRVAGRAEVRRLARALDAFVRGARWWLERDALWEVLDEVHGGAPWSTWPALDRRLFAPSPADAEAAAERRRRLLAERDATVARYAFEQFVAHAQHAALRARSAALGLSLWGDLQVGFAPRDVWAHQARFLAGWALGAPPSRTNPGGQPWGYPVLDPADAAATAAFVAARFDKLFAEFDGVRLDHPHGYVCPWVYRPGGPDAAADVRAGTRLFESPDVPALADFARVTAAQLNPDPVTPRWADDWVVTLTPAQARAYGALVDEIVAAARRHGRGPAALACEVLSTCPLPLRRVLEAHGLGRFRIAQKASLTDPCDPYRSEHAEPADWVMLGNHDTTPIWLLLDDWARAGQLGDRARHLAHRLGRDGAFARALAASPGLLAHAQLADLLASRARHVMVFFTDAFGMRERYNRAGVVSEENWILRLPADWRARLRARLARDEALNLPLTLALALRARGRTEDDLAARLEELARGVRAGAAPLA